MKLRRLALHGFKSFADRTELSFSEGITAIVGPNGCGKSNISDAIRWVLGEQRASAIRGSRMDEAIFQGTAERRGLSRAEVALVFSNEDGRLALPHDEIEIRRTIFREGGSEYALNRASCRLKDLLDLVRDTGLGANAYAVIEQRMVDAILSDRAEERRALFEEAAGIGRYKDRRRAAQRRLEAAEADLARLEDVIGEVRTKVRSLARQRSRAQRYGELRSRRLALEVAVAAVELEEIQAALTATAARLAELSRDEPAVRASLSATEMELERRRLETGEAARERGTVAARVEEVTRRIAERERELAVAEERQAHAERRLRQIAAEREELEARRRSLEAGLTGIEDGRTEQRGRLDAVGASLSLLQERQRVQRAELEAARHSDDRARADEEALSRDLARLEAAAAAASARAEEAESRVGRLDAEAKALDADLGRLDEQGDLFADRTRALAAVRLERDAERQACATRLEALRAQEAAARSALVEAEDEAGTITARLASLEALERDHQGLTPAVGAALTARERLEGLLGPLADFLELPPARAASVETTLMSLLQVLVVRDAAAAEQIRRWLEAERPDEGALALLPRAALPQVRTLLDAIDFAGRPPSEPVLLGRRERIEALRSQVAAAARVRDERAAARAALADQVVEAEAALRAAEAAAQAAELELRRAESDAVARTGQRERMQRAREELDRQRADAMTAAEQARDEAAQARAERDRLEAERATRRAAREATARLLAEREAAWAAVRDEEAELRIEHARVESELSTLDRRATAAREGLADITRRAGVLDREEAEHQEALRRIEQLRATSGAELEALFERREALAAELRTLDERLAAAAEATDSLEAELRTLRRSAEERGEERHRLELRRTEEEAGARRVRERLEAEWGRPFEQLVREADTIDGEIEMLRAELRAVTADLDHLGPINMLAVEEHEEESARLDFLAGQHDDLLRARDDLRTAIREINLTARSLFADTFEAIRANFQRTFQTLFEGGECDLRLADEDDPLESDIEVSASPRGKRTQRINLLSGGERALTALSLLFAIYLVKPSPFCVLDEVDAPLDEANIGRFIGMLQRFKAETQFIIITHNPRTIEAADWIYGVTMEDPGVSRIVGVRLDEALVTAGGSD